MRRYLIASAIALCLSGAAFAEEPASPSQALNDAELSEALGIPAPFFTPAFCSASLYCDNGATVACSCSNGGSCTDHPGNPWGGYVTCQCTGQSRPTSYYCQEPNTCVPSQCDAQCGGPGYGICSGTQCYCY